MKIISFYTTGENSSYQAEAELMVESLEALGLDYHMAEIPDQGGWQKNTAFKAAFIHSKRKELRGPLLWIDADAYVHSDPTAYFTKMEKDGFDFGAHFFMGPAKGHRFHEVREEGWRLLSGTTWWGDTPKALQLASAWAQMNRTLAKEGILGGGGQKNLWYLMTCMEKLGLKVKKMPGRYTFVFDKPFAYPHLFRPPRGSGRPICQLCNLGEQHKIHDCKEDEPRIIEHSIASRDHRDPTKTRKDPSRGKRIRELRKGGA
jgi:hypothetical protein